MIKNERVIDSLKIFLGAHSVALVRDQASDQTEVHVIWKIPMEDFKEPQSFFEKFKSLVEPIASLMRMKESGKITALEAQIDGLQTTVDFYKSEGHSIAKKLADKDDEIKGLKRDRDWYKNKLERSND